ncbi:MAG: SO2930 family diheme c-type cytochrome [Microscillaceae bacterium]|nr:SO2930 family diheme c-type cytochrome [Microscillaceae bacterium]
MKYLLVFVFSIFGLLVLMSSQQQPTANFAPKAKLSEYGLFTGNLMEMRPSEGVIPYELNTPLFSDYAGKLRFVKLPPGTVVNYNDTEVFDFPVGTILVKTFYYTHDFRDESKGRTLLETRLLIHEEKSWLALPYVWNETQTEAYLEVAGAEKPIQWKDLKGKKQGINYVIPNMNQCKGCHNRKEKLSPIGPSARQLHGEMTYADGVSNQLQKWKSRGMLVGLPENLKEVPRVPVWNDPQSGDLNSRARAYLDINCAHCHRPDGPANTSGLFLQVHEENPTALGIQKTPVAAGRGSGGLNFDIVPGNPDASILLYRMNSHDPGVMMPELGRQLIHQEGVALIREWIQSLK